MKIHYILHTAFESLGVIEKWAKDQGHQLRGTRVHLGEALPSDCDSSDMVIIMGGPQSVNDLDRFPFLQDEIDYVAKCIAKNKKVLGICLGAQVITKALSGHVPPAQEKEIGIYPVQLTAEGEKDPVFSGFGASFDAMHWHNESIQLPKDCVCLAQTATTPVQAYRYGDRVYALQFHLESTQGLVKGMLDHFSYELTPGRYVSAGADMLLGDFAALNKRLLQLVSCFSELPA